MTIPVREREKKIMKHSINLYWKVFTQQHARISNFVLLSGQNVDETVRMTEIVEEHEVKPSRSEPKQAFPQLKDDRSHGSVL